MKRAHKVAIGALSALIAITLVCAGLFQVVNRHAAELFYPETATAARLVDYADVAFEFADEATPAWTLADFESRARPSRFSGQVCPIIIDWPMDEPQEKRIVLSSDFACVSNGAKAWYRVLVRLTRSEEGEWRGVWTYNTNQSLDGIVWDFDSPSRSIPWSRFDPSPSVDR